MSQASTPSPSVCYNHPNRESMLRCNRCDRNICPDCAVLTPTGYRCKECIRGQQKIFNTAVTIDYPIAFVVAAGLSFVGSLIAGMLGLWSIFLAPLAGGVTAEVVRWAIRRHRSPSLYLTAAAGAVCGALPPVLIALLVGNFFGLLWPAVYVILITPTVYYRLRGIRMN
jgi:hypothetical protein